MTALTSLTQAERAELGWIEPLHFVSIALSGLTLNFSDRDYRYTYGASEILYESYVHEISGLGNVVESGDSYNNSVRIMLKNEPWSSYSYLISLNAVNAFSRATVTVYELRIINEDETFSSDVRTTLWKGSVESIEDISKEFFTLNCSSRLYDKRNSFGLERLKTSTTSGISTYPTYSSIDPNDIGKYRNILYGILEKVPCRNVLTGGIDLLAHDLSTSDANIELSGITRVDLSSSGTVQIDTEQITYTRTSAYQLAIVSRGANSTEVTTHNKGAPVYQVLTEFLYEVAKHPVNSITYTFVDDVRQTSVTPDPSVTTYTGQSGNQYGGSSNAYVHFNTRPVVEQQVNLGINDHSHVVSDPTHVHDTNPTSGVLENVFPTGHSISGWSDPPVTNPESAYDDTDPDNASWALIDHPSLGPSYYNTLTLNLPDNSGLGTLNMAEIKVYQKRPTGGTSIYKILWGGEEVLSTTANLDEAWYSYYHYTNSWASSVSFTVYGSSGSVGSDAWIYEVKITYNYTIPSEPTSYQSTGVTNVEATTIIGGLTTADIVIGKEVTVDVEGYRDDALGTYTGGYPSSLIVRPSDIIMHMLMALAGFTAADIDTTSWDTARAWYISNSYASALIVHDIGEELNTIIADIAKQVHSYFYEWAGDFFLKVLPSSAPTVDFVLIDDDFVEYPIYSYTGSDEIKNDIDAFYRKDYRGTGGRTDNLLNRINPDAMAEGYFDMVHSSTGSADLHEDMHLNTVRTQTMAQAICDFWRTYKSSSKLILSNGVLKWRSIQGAPGQYFSYTDPIFGAKTFRITKFMPDRANGTITISGVEAP